MNIGLEFHLKISEIDTIDALFDAIYIMTTILTLLIILTMLTMLTMLTEMMFSYMAIKGQSEAIIIIIDQLLIFVL